MTMAQYYRALVVGPVVLLMLTGGHLHRPLIEYVLTWVTLAYVIACWPVAAWLEHRARMRRLREPMPNRGPYR